MSEKENRERLRSALEVDPTIPNTTAVDGFTGGDNCNTSKLAMTIRGREEKEEEGETAGTEHGDRRSTVDTEQGGQRKAGLVDVSDNGQWTVPSGKTEN